MLRRTVANRSKSRRFTVLNGCSSKNGTTVAMRSARRFTEKRRSCSRWLSWRLLSMTYPHPNSSMRSSSADLDDRGLGDRELVLDLPAESATRVAHHRDREAAFAVDEADDPLLDHLAFPADCPHRTDFHCPRRTLSRGCDTYERVPPDTRGFQHIASCTQFVTALRGNSLAREVYYLRTVIVTAAVYRGLGSELRLAANPSP